MMKEVGRRNMVKKDWEGNVVKEKGEKEYREEGQGGNVARCPRVFQLSNFFS